MKQKGRIRGRRNRQMIIIMFGNFNTPLLVVDRTNRQKISKHKISEQLCQPT